MHDMQPAEEIASNDIGQMEDLENISVEDLENTAEDLENISDGRFGEHSGDETEYDEDETEYDEDATEDYADETEDELDGTDALEANENFKTKMKKIYDNFMLKPTKVSGSSETN